MYGLSFSLTRKEAPFN